MELPQGRVMGLEKGFEHSLHCINRTISRALLKASRQVSVVEDMNEDLISSELLRRELEAGWTWSSDMLLEGDEQVI